MICHHEGMRRPRLIAVFLASLAFLTYNLGSSPIAAGYTDPIARIEAQDEALYSSLAARMVERGGWLTPNFLGRLSLVKPPLAVWLSAASAKCAGIRTWSLRLPSVVAGAAAITLAFHWAGPPAALLLISNRQFFTLARLNLTDALLLVWLMLAFWVLARKPRLEERRWLWIFGAAAGLALMTKSVAGAAPILAVVVLALARKTPWKHAAQAIAIAVLIALPWHLYQLAVHPHWFRAEYVLDEHLAFGAGAPPQTTHESQPGFYASRLWALDPFLTVIAIASLPWTWRRAPLVWLAIACGSLFLYQYRNATYLLAVYAALALSAASGRAMTLVAAAVLLVKIVVPQTAWGLTWKSAENLPSVPALRQYCEWNRPQELILVLPDDQFHSAVLPLAKVRYVFLRGPDPRLALDFRQLGITVTVDEFLSLDSLRGAYLERLRAMDLDSGEPLATAILARDREDIARLVAARPQSDFFLPEELGVSSGVHNPVAATGGRVFLLSKEPRPPAARSRGCRL